MARLIEQPIPSLFHGVSRQPDHLRHPGQVEECVNHILSVERGGAEKRFGSSHIRNLSWLDATQPVQLHAIDRDGTERYLVAVQNGVLKVYETNGTERTVTIAGAAGSYIAGNAESDLVLVTVADYTFLLNRTKTVAMTAAVAPTPTPRVVVYISGARQGTFGVKLNGVSFTNNPATANPSAGTIASEIAAGIAGVAGTPWQIQRSNSYFFIERTDGADFTADPVEDYAGFTILWKDRVAVSSALPPRAVNGTVFRVGSATSDSGFHVKFAARSGSFDGVWEETAKPGVRTDFDATTLPHLLVREAGGTFTLKAATWNPRLVGDDDTAPVPEFVGRTLSDIAFHRGRMIVVWDESEFASRAGDLFNFWPERTTQITDADPFSLSAQGANVALLRFAVPFRQTLFLTSAQRQFEVTGDVFAAGKCALGPTSAYSASDTCRPVPMNDALYLVAKDGAGSALLEYAYDSQSLVPTAEDMTRHARGYVPANVQQMVGDSISGSMVLRPPGIAAALYLYTFFWQGREQVQSAWHKWTLGDGVRSIALMVDSVYAVVRRGGADFLERVPLRRPDETAFSFPPRLDRQVRVTGTYSSVTGKTTWTLPYTDTAATAVPEASHAPTLALVATNIGGTTITAPGDWSARSVMIGTPFLSYLDLSRLFLRENNVAVITGRTQVRYLTLVYADARVFTSQVTHDSGAVSETIHVVPHLGTITTLPSSTPLGQGVERVRVMGRNTTTHIRLVNDTLFPHLIAGGAWASTFNEVTRQG